VCVFAQVLSVINVAANDACVLTAKVGDRGGTGTHVIRAGASTTTGVPASTDPYYTGTVQEAPGAAFCRHASKLPVHNNTI